MQTKNPGDHPRAYFLTLMAGVLIVGFFLRLRGIGTQLWLDEIWSLRLSQQLHSVTEVVTRLRIDNNHPLTSLWMYVFRDEPAWYFLRFPSFLAGLFLLGVVYVVSRAKRPFEGIVLFSFFAFSYPIVLYSSEARGYAAMLACALFSYALLEHAIAQKKFAWYHIPLFWIASILGALSHLTFLHFFFACLLWLIVLAMRKRISWSRCFLLCAVPLLAFLAWYILFARFLPPGTGPIGSFLEVILDAVSVGFGGPLLASQLGIVGFAIACFVLVLALLEIVFLVREKDERVVLYIGAIFLAPLLSLWVLSPRVIFVRYFLVSLIFLFLLIAHFFQRMWQSSHGGKIVSFLLFVTFLFGTGTYHQDFLRYGRGQYQEALQFIRENNNQASFVLAVDHSFRNRMVVEFYAEIIPLAPSLEIVEQKTLSSEKSPQADWLLLHRLVSDMEYPQSVSAANNGVYQYRKSFSHTALSGWTWHLYQRKDLLKVPVVQSAG